MRGSVMRRGRSWSYVVYSGRDAQGGKRQKWKGGVATISSRPVRLASRYVCCGTRRGQLDQRR